MKRMSKFTALSRFVLHKNLFYKNLPWQWSGFREKSKDISSSENGDRLRMLSLDEGDFLVKASRNSFFTYLGVKSSSDSLASLSPGLRKKMGAYIRVGTFAQDRKHPELILGFTGYPIPTKSVYQSVLDASVAIAARVRGFQADWSKIEFEVTILSPPQSLKEMPLAEVASAIEFGRDAVMIASGLKKAIILPQTAITKCKDQVTLIAECCTAAGLMADTWINSPEVDLYKLRTQIFREKGKRKRVTEVLL